MQIVLFLKRGEGKVYWTILSPIVTVSNSALVKRRLAPIFNTISQSI